MTIRKWEVGDGVASRTTVRDRNGSLYDPEEIKLLLRSPSGTETQVNPTRVSVGVFEATFVLNEAGVWYRRWKITGNANAVDEAPLVVSPTNFVAP